MFYEYVCYTFSIKTLCCSKKNKYTYKQTNKPFVDMKTWATLDP